MFDAFQNTCDADDILIAKSSFDYDNYAAMDGIEDYVETIQNDLPWWHAVFSLTQQNSNQLRLNRLEGGCL